MDKAELKEVAEEAFLAARVNSVLTGGYQYDDFEQWWYYFNQED